MPLWLIRVDNSSRGSTAGSYMHSEDEVNEMPFTDWSVT